MVGIVVNRDYDDLRGKVIQINDTPYVCACGTHSVTQAEIEAKSYKNPHAKIIVCRSYYVCIPEEEHNGRQQFVKDAKKTVKLANKSVHETSGALLEGHKRGTNAMREILGWGPRKY